MDVADNEIHLWFSCDRDIQEHTASEKYLRLLDESEKKRHQTFRFDQHKHQYLVTRALIRTVLSMYHPDVAPEQWQFKKNKHGKPFIGNVTSYDTVTFNVSHTDGLIVLAIAKTQEVGVDVEFLNRRGRLLEVADRYFSPSEIEALFSLPEEMQRTRFFDLWTLKEAYIKACGMGLAIPLRHFSYQLDTDTEIDITFDPARDDVAELWQFWSLEYDNLHPVALAVRNEEAGGISDIKYYSVTPLQDTQEIHCNVIRKTGGVL